MNEYNLQSRISYASSEACLDTYLERSSHVGLIIHDMDYGPHAKPVDRPGDTILYLKPCSLDKHRIRSRLINGILTTF